MDRERSEMLDRCKVFLTCKVYFTYKTYNSDDVLSQIGEDQALS